MVMGAVVAGAEDEELVIAMEVMLGAIESR